MRDIQFTGRRSLLDNIQAHFQMSHSQAIPAIFALFGQAGVGKTQIAIEYAYAHSTYFSSVFWIDATTRASVKDSFVRIAYRLLKHYREILERDDFVEAAMKLDLVGYIDELGRIPSALDMVDGVIARTITWFTAEGNSKWLLVFDNADDPESFDITEYFPKVPQGSILLTTRRRDIPPLWEAVEVNEMESDESIELLRRRAMLGQEIDQDGEALTQ